MVIERLTKLGRRMHSQSRDFNKEIANVKKNQAEVAELKNAITEPKNTLEGFNRRLD